MPLDSTSHIKKNLYSQVFPFTTESGIQDHMELKSELSIVLDSEKSIISKDYEVVKSIDSLRLEQSDDN